jgi:hypothetical protein
LGGDAEGLVAMAADQGGDAGVLGLGGAGEEVSGNAAKAYDGVAYATGAFEGGGLG